MEAVDKKTRSIVKSRRAKPNSLTSQTELALQAVCNFVVHSFDQPIAIWLPKHRNQSFVIHEILGLPETYKSQASAIEGDDSIVSNVVETNTKKLVADIFKVGLPPYYHTLAKTDYKAVLAAPVLLKERTIGVVEIFGRDAAQLKLINNRYLQSISNIISIAVDSEKRSYQAGKLAEFTRKLSSEIGLQPAMQIIADGARELTSAHSTTIVLFQKKSDKFLIRASSRADKHQTPPPEPRAKEGLTRLIHESGQTIIIPDTQKEKRVQQEVIDAGIRSLVGIQVKRGKNFVGVLWVNGSNPNHFSPADVQLLTTLAAQVSVAMHWASGIINPASEIERVTLNLYKSKDYFKNICDLIKKTLGFDYAAVQLVRPEERIIETVYGTNIAEEYSGLAKHPLERDPELLDIQAYIATSNPPRIEIIGGWNKRFHRWLYDSYSHKDLVRVWVPILICRDSRGRVRQDWLDTCIWNPVEEDRNPDGWRTSFELQLDPNTDSEVSNVECIGTVDAGYANPSSIITLKQASRMAKLVNHWALKMRKAQLPYVLETIANNAQTILKASTAGLYFSQDREGRYAYEIRAETQGLCARAHYRPYLLKLETEVIKTNKPRIIPNPSEEEPTLTLKEASPELYNCGVRTIAVFPLIADNTDAKKQGILYLYFNKQYPFTEDEIIWANTFARWAVDAIQHATYYMQSRDSSLRLNSLNNIAQSLVKNPEKTQNLLYRIAGNTLSVLAADVVSIYEYIEHQNSFPSPPDIVGRLRNENMILEVTDENSPPTKLIRHGKNIYPPESLQLLNSPNGRNRKGLTNFVTRENIKSTAGLLLKVANEIVGVMFINYRTLHIISEEEKRAMNILASSAAIAIKTKRSYRAVSLNLNRREQEILALRAIEQEIGASRNKSPNLKNIYNLILDKALEITGAHHGALLHYDRSNETLTVNTYRGKMININSYYSQKLGYGITGLAAKKQESILVSDISSDEFAGFYNPVITDSKSELAVPIVDDNGLIGIINIEHPNVGGLCENDKLFVKMLALQAVISRHSVDLYNKYIRQIKPRQSLNVIYTFIQNTPFHLDTALYELLTGITSGEGLGFSRAVLFVLENNAVVGKIAIGSLSQSSAQSTWFNLEREYRERKHADLEVDILNSLLKEHSHYYRMASENKTKRSAFEQKVRGLKLTLDNRYGGALFDSIKRRQTISVDYLQEDPFRYTIQQFTNKHSEYNHPFACVPLVAGQTVYGVIYVDNCFLGEEVERNKYLFDIDGLENYAAVAALLMKINDMKMMCNHSVK